MYIEDYELYGRCETCSNYGKCMICDDCDEGSEYKYDGSIDVKKTNKNTILSTERK